MSLLFILDETKPEPSEIHPQYKGRTKAFSSSTNTHSLLLMDITEADLMLYCCVDFQLKQHNCTKLDLEDVRSKEVDLICADHPAGISTCSFLLVIIGLLLLLLMSNICVLWRCLQKGTTKDVCQEGWILGSLQDRGDWTLTEVLYTSSQCKCS
ncbi:hypothetical protein DNTS_006103 [Danionella cerebrum]|uniref:Uncharacterized protein n=1 Tax=Danionella cerebrum TaxID=2873325 RepID=A0A553QMG3_9TELE|nr:hypothetical protein DNTS_006103 [Danionella translucida]